MTLFVCLHKSQLDAGIVLYIECRIPTWCCDSTKSCSLRAMTRKLVFTIVDFFTLLVLIGINTSGLELEMRE